MRRATKRTTSLQTQPPHRGDLAFGVRCEPEGVYKDFFVQLAMAGERLQLYIGS